MMKNDENNIVVLVAIVRYFLILAIFLGTITVLVSCEKDPEIPSKEIPDGQTPDGETPDEEIPQDTTQTDMSADELTELLLFENSTKMSGDLPVSPDGGLFMNASDTIFTVDKRFCNSLQVKHDTVQKISGFNVKLKGAESYMYVPISEETQLQIDSITAFCLDIEAPCLTTAQITIQALGESGAPLDEFERWIKIECIGGDASRNHLKKYNSAASKATCTLFTCGSDSYWLWNFRYDAGAGRTNRHTPGFKNILDKTVAGCCSPTGMSVAAWQSLGCYEDNDSGFDYKLLTTNDYWRRNYEHLFLCEDGSAEVHTDYESEWTANDGTDVDYCNETIFPDLEINDYINTGTHDYTAGDDDINFFWKNPEGEWRREGGRIEFSCNTLIIYHNVEGVYDDVTIYKRSPRGAKWFE